MKKMIFRSFKIVFLFLLFTFNASGQNESLCGNTDGNATITETLYEYNIENLQPSKISKILSNGKKEVMVVTYPQDYTTGTGFIDDLISKNVISVPIEKVVFEEDACNETNRKILSGEITTYYIGGKGLLENSYSLETSSPIDLANFRFSNKSTNGILSNTGTKSSYNLNTTLYKLQAKYEAYDEKGNILQARREGDIPTSVMWGNNKSQPVAVVKNADKSQIAYGGFDNFLSANVEENMWWVDDEIISKSTQPENVFAGQGSVRVFPVNGTNWGPATNITPISQSGKYKISCWIKTTSGFVNGKAGLKAYTVDATTCCTQPTGVTGNEREILFNNTNGKWQYYEMIYDFDKIKSQKSGMNLSLRCHTFNMDPSASIYVDEMRMLPIDAEMTTYSYDPLMGLTSSIAPNGVTLKYEYDALGRLKFVRDIDGNIVKKYDYNYSTSTTTYNYVLETTVLVEGKKLESDLATLTVDQVSKKYSYFDGLGRPLQNVLWQGSPLKKDVVEFFDYDVYGRLAKNYLPYSASVNTGAFKINALSEQYNFYNDYTGGPNSDRIPNSTVAYSESVFESSPLNRVTEQAAPGEAWKIGSGKTIKYKQRTNSSNEVRLWKFSDYSLGTISASTFYVPGSLSVGEVTDEKGQKTIEYKDLNGKLVLKMVAEGTTFYASTYYIYDDFGNLRYVLSPKAVNAISDWSLSYNYDSDLIKNLCYWYKYDSRQRLIEKKLPGADPVYYVYDKLDRLVMTQDGNQRINWKWSFSRYDALSRPVLTGIYTHSNNATRDQMVTLVNSFRLNANREAGSSHGYYDTDLKSNSYDYEVLTVNYYDDYNFDFNDNNGVSATDDYSFNSSTGLSPSPVVSKITFGVPTGSKTKVLGSNDYLKKVLFYDKYGRLIQSQGNNHLNINSLGEHTTIGYDFAGKIMKERTYHNPSTSTSTQLSTLKEYVYDHAGRLKETWHQYNSNAKVRISQLVYNQIGQVVEKNLHSNNLQSVDFTYNMRGWLTHINNSKLNNPFNSDNNNNDGNDLFGMELMYQNTYTDMATTPMFDGSISAVKWKVNNPLNSAAANEKSYVYKYNYNGSLFEARYREYTTSWSTGTRNYERVSGYDINGNITGLLRYNGAGSLIDNLGYTYGNNGKSNQLIAIVDASNNSSGYNYIHARGGGYSYDANGNLSSDGNKGISISYNHLNLPTRIEYPVANNLPQYIYYTYDAGGRKLKKTSANGVVTNYVDNYLYNGTTLQSVMHEEGRVVFNGNLSAPKYEYFIKDHLGNTRVAFTEENGVAKITQESHYYPFGMQLDGGYNSGLTSPTNKFLYNGKEFQDDVIGGRALNWYDYGARFYDPIIGRWNVQDALSEKFLDLSPYNYGLNNPISMIDPDGNEAYHFEGQEAQEVFKRLRTESNARSSGSDGGGDKNKDGDRNKNGETEEKGVIDGVKDGMSDLFTLRTWTEPFKQMWEMNKLFYTNPEEAGRTLTLQSHQTVETMKTFDAYDWTRFGTTALGQVLLTRGTANFLTFNAYGGWGWRIKTPYGKLQLMYQQGKNLRGGTLIAWNSKNLTWRVDYHSFGLNYKNNTLVPHYHFARRLEGMSNRSFDKLSHQHRSLYPSNFGQIFETK